MPSNEANPGTNSVAGNHESSSIADTKMGSEVQNTLANNPNQPATPSLAGTPAATEQKDQDSDITTQAAGEAATPDNAAPATTSSQPNAYGGNFGNDVQNSYQDPDRASNQQSSANRGAFGEHGQLGATHNGYGNQYREFDTAAERPAAEATEEKYYGEGASRPGLQHNSYQNYDGNDSRPVEQGHAVHDTPAVRVRTFEEPTTTPTDGRGNTQDNRNLPGKTGPEAAFQNDNGALTVGPAYADDYGHTSGVGLPAGTPSHHLPLGPNGHGDVEDERSSRGGYDNQGSQGGRSHDQQPGSNAATTAPAPVNSPDAPQTEGYGYGHERSEQAQPGNPKTGDSRTGFESGSSQEGDASQGYGSQGGSYDDQNPGARGPQYDNFTQQDKAKNYGQDQRGDYRPAEDQPKDADYGAAPRRNAGRDESAQ